MSVLSFKEVSLFNGCSHVMLLLMLREVKWLVMVISGLFVKHWGKVLIGRLQHATVSALPRFQDWPILINHVNLSVRVWDMNPYSRVREKDTSYRNDYAFEDVWASTDIILQMMKWGTVSTIPLSPMHMKICSTLHMDLQRSSSRARYKEGEWKSDRKRDGKTT